MIAASFPPILDPNIFDKYALAPEGDMNKKVKQVALPMQCWW